MADQNIFITGSEGKIGQFLVGELRKKDCTMLLLDNSGVSKQDDAKVKYVHGDLLKPKGYASSLKGIDVVVHMAAITHTNRVQRYYDVNVRGTLDLVEASRRNGVKRFVFVSTRAIAEDGGDYSRSKLMAERYVKDSSFEWVILRPAEVYGMGVGKGVDMLLDSMQKLPIIPIMGDGSYNICPVYVEDLVSSIEQAITKSDIGGRTYTIAGPKSYTYNELIDVILNAQGSKKLKIHIPFKLAALALKISALIFGDRFMVMDQLPRLVSKKYDDISAARQDLSFNPRGIADVLPKGVKSAR